jgi:hypothetical protein
VSRESDQEARMYHPDPNINAAVERQAERVRAVQAYGSRETLEQPTSPPANDAGQPAPLAGTLALALAAMPIAVLVVWGILRAVR